MSLQWDIEARDQASQALNNIRQGAEQMTSALDGAGRESAESLQGADAALRQASDGADEMGASVGDGVPNVIALNQALEVGEKVITAFTTAASVAIDVGQRAVRAWQEQDSALRDLSHSLCYRAR